MTPSRTSTQHLRHGTRHIAPPPRAEVRRPVPRNAPTVSVVLVAERPDAAFVVLLHALASHRELVNADLVAVLGAPLPERAAPTGLGESARCLVQTGATRAELRALGMREGGDIVTLLEATVSVADAVVLARHALEAASRMRGTLDGGSPERALADLPIAR
jgi:hypothetical protein